MTHMKCPSILQRHEVAEADGGQGDEGVVDRVEEGPTLLRVVHDRAARDHERRRHAGGLQTIQCTSWAVVVV